MAMFRGARKATKKLAGDVLVYVPLTVAVACTIILIPIRRLSPSPAWYTLVAG